MVGNISKVVNSTVEKIAAFMVWHIASIMYYGQVSDKHIKNEQLYNT